MLHEEFYFEPYDDILVKSEAGCDRYQAVYVATPDHPVEHDGGNDGNRGG